MAHTNLTSNPFALMMMPEAIFAAIEHSDRLGRLKSRICRPLDGPRAPQVVADVSSFDAAIDSAVEPAEELAEAPTIHPDISF